MRAGWALAMGVNLQGMLVDGKAVVLCHHGLPIFDFGIKEFFYMTAVEADQMIVVGSTVQLKYSFPALEMVAYEQSGLFELGKDTVNRGQTDFYPIVLQSFVNILGTQMTGGAVFEQSQHLEARKGSLEADIFEILGYAHRVLLKRNRLSSLY
jgi:hypothetical protein